MIGAKDDKEQSSERFFKIPQAVISSGLLAMLKPSELKVYLVIASYANFRGRFAFPSVGLICEKSGINKNLIGKATRRITAFGLITKKRAPRAFKFKNVYRMVDDPKNEASTIPLKTDKRSIREHGKGGRWAVIPRNTELDVLPRNTESIFFPGKTEHKEIELKINRDSFKSNPIPISKKTKEEVEKVKGKKYVQDQIDAGLYVIIEDPILEDSGKDHE